MEMLNDQDLGNIVGGLNNYMNKMPKETALEIAENLSEEERRKIANIRQPLTRSEFIRFWENSNNTTL